MTSPTEDLATAWRAARPAGGLVHLDSAACARQSAAVLDAVAGHAAREAAEGGYVAQDRAGLDGTRADLAGMLGRQADDVVFTHSGAEALTTLLAAWPLPPGAVVACGPGEFGPNLAAFHDRGVGVRVLPTEPCGLVDVGVLASFIHEVRPALLHLGHLSSHRGIVQPVAEVAAVCRAQEVPCVVDAAQSLGQADTRIDAAAIYATSRKWLAGPRGVGVLAVSPELAALLRPHAPSLDEPWWPYPHRLLRLEAREAHVAGRVGLGVAVREHLALGPARVWHRLAEVGRLTRDVLDGAGGWRVVEPRDTPSALTTLRPPPGVDVLATRDRLVAEHGIVTTACGPERAPLELSVPVLRVSPHVDVDVAELELLAGALG